MPHSRRVCALQTLPIANLTFSRRWALIANFTLAEDQAAVHEEKKAFPDLRMTVDMMVAGGDLVTVVWTFRGTNSAAGYGLPATGAKVEVRGITVWRITDGLIREEWTSFNELARSATSNRRAKIRGIP